MTPPTLNQLIERVCDVEEKAYEYVNPLPECETGKECDQVKTFKAGAATQLPLRKALEEALRIIDWHGGFTKAEFEKIRAILEGGEELE